VHWVSLFVRFLYLQCIFRGHDELTFKYFMPIPYQHSIEYNEVEQKCETHIDFVTDRKDNDDTLCCAKEKSFTSLPVDWKYACGSESCNEAVVTGTMTFNAQSLTAGNTYEAHLLSKTGFSIKAKTQPFVIVGDGL